MDSIFVFLLLVVGLPAVFVVAFVVIVFRRGLQMNQLVAAGVETLGTITSKQTHHRKSVKTYHLGYRYTDGQGQSHNHRSMVEGSIYRAFEEKGAIPVIYSASKPSVSAPRYLVEQTREAKEQQKARQEAKQTSSRD